MLLDGAWLQGISLIVLVVIFQVVVVTQIHLNKDAKRRWQHALTGHALVQVSFVLPVEVCIVLLLLGASLIAIIQIFFFETFIQLFGEILRPEERAGHRLPGAFYFLLGAAVTAYLVPLPVARYAVECLSMADPMASWIGSSVRSPNIHSSASVAGCLACFVSAYLLGFLYLPSLAVSLKQRLLGAMACTIAEALSFDYDNLLVPILTAAAVEVK